jgi:2-hydroxy-3-oxopropionate reductase
MGLPMGKNLVAAGHHVIGFTRTKERGRPLEEAGGTLSDSVSSAVSGADAVITVLPDSPDVQAVYADTHGVFEAAEPGTLLIDMSTIRPNVAAALNAEAAGRGFDMLDAPVSGGEKGAEDGVLSIMVGGEPATFESAKPLLEVMGSTVVLVGGAGSGQTVKAANQLMVAGIIELVSEALVFLDAHDVELEPAIQVLNGGLAGNTVLTRKAAAMLAGNFAPGFRVELHHKDLGIYREAARSHDVFSPLGALLGELMASLRVGGGAQLDHGALLAQVDTLSGRSRWSAS